MRALFFHQSRGDLRDIAGERQRQKTFAGPCHLPPPPTGWSSEYLECAKYLDLSKYLIDKERTIQLLNLLGGKRQLYTDI